MGPVGIALLALLLAGAAASWATGVMAFRRAQARSSRGASSWLAALAWPLGIAKLQETAPEQAAVVNKAIVAFFVCVTLAVTTISLSTNLNRLSHWPR